MRRLLPLLLPLAMSVSPTAHAGTSGLRVEGTVFVLRQQDGQVLRSPDMVGAELELGDGSVLRIDAVRTDPQDASGRTLLHRFSQREGDGPWREVCEADREGRREGFPVQGHWDAQGRYRLDQAHFALTCTGGAQAKCVRFGYMPWADAPDGTPMPEMYAACVHMVRADYCGDGEASTRDGTEIDIYDHHGVWQPGGEAEFRFEAGWSPQGAVCVHHARIPQNLDLATLAARCPRLRTAIGAACTEGAAEQAGAVLFNRSR
ncbi:ADYC domain-containing protein [Luteimonas salinilitoris]|uniref:ADYC domain-containing protein n=1 Tax=Luteimonas salinilitoris TaxID=3237697 RepID=A0ABV4HQP5_9GAMM